MGKLVRICHLIPVEFFLDLLTEPQLKAGMMKFYLQSQNLFLIVHKCTICIDVDCEYLLA